MRGIAVLAAMVLAGMVTASPLVACPFISHSQADQDACCPRKSEPLECPLAPTLQTCPYYVTESKIGTAKLKAPDAVLLITTSPVESPPAAVQDRHAPEDFQARSEIYLRNRVLRI
ncbi:MAG: hypothetical protein FJW37_00160 [Acidobacteria bacterium]|nr:hypothetical protein [Acidobacteriota bacterium]